MFFFILPVGVDYRARRWPVVTFTLIGLNVLVQLYSMSLWFAGPKQFEGWVETYWLIPAKSVWFTYATSMFVHGGIIHLLGNMVYLFLFGACVEDLIGRGRFTVFYLLGGLAAAFAHIALTPEHFAAESPLGGASGAISACMGGFVLLLHRTQIEFKYFGFFLFRFFAGEFHLRSWLVMSFWFLEDVFSAVLDYRVGQEGGGTAFGAHVGGFLFGLAVIAGLKPFLRANDDDDEAPRIHKRLVPVEVPIAAPAGPQFFLFEGGLQSGPFTLDEVWQRLENGSATRQAQYWCEGMAEWKSIEDIL